MTTMTDNRYAVEELWVDSVLTRSVDADWDTIGGEYREGFTSYEAPECETCGEYGKPENGVWVCDNAECENHAGEIDDAVQAAGWICPGRFAKRSRGWVGCPRCTSATSPRWPAKTSTATSSMPASGRPRLRGGGPKGQLSV